MKMFSIVKQATTTVLIGIVAGGCTLFSPKEPPEKIGWTELLAAAPELYYKDDCMQRVPPNILRKNGYVYPSFTGWPGVAPGMYERFRADKTKYNRLIIGDSTAHSWTTIPGLIVGWRNTAVGGNRVCDMISQSRKYHDDDIREVIISTNGGNDILGGTSSPDLLRDVSTLLARVRTLFPKTKITLVGVHPVMDGGLFPKIRALNLEVANIAKREKVCYVNPEKVLGVDRDGRLPTRYRLTMENGEIDTIHYNELAAKEIFAAALKCRR